MNSEFIKKNIKFILPGIGIGIFILLYLLGVWFFQSHFVPNTKVGAISVSQMTLEHAQEHIQQELEEQQMLLVENEQELGYIELSQVKIQSDMREVLLGLLDEQSAAKWPVYLFKGPEKISDLDEYVDFEHATLEALLANIGVNNSERPVSEDAYIGISDQGVYQIKEEVYGQQISVASLETALETQLETGQSKLDLSAAYIQPLVHQDTPEVIALQTRLDQMQKVAITLELDGQAIEIPSSEIASWIFVDESQEPQINLELIEEYLYGLNEEYASLFKTRQFASTYQGTVTVDPGTYGWYIDRFTEAENIAANIMAGEDATREPVIGGSGYGLTIDNDLGASYVEVDVYHQMMTIYIEGEVALQTAIVTGTPGTNTVPGTYQVWNKEEDSTLVGYNPRTEMDYEQPVDFWIAFDDQAQGIHDAGWQSSFGGEAYLSNGSLGCINTPPGVMPDVFELVYYGMPVIIF